MCSLPRWVSDQCWNVLSIWSVYVQGRAGDAYNLDQVQIVQIEAPCPDTYKTNQTLIISYYEDGALPITTIIATLYGSGRIRLNASSCGPSPGSRSMLRRLCHDFETGPLEALPRVQRTTPVSVYEARYHATFSCGLSFEYPLVGVPKRPIAQFNNLGLPRSPVLEAR
jgi:hypothetical protein